MSEFEKLVNFVQIEIDTAKIKKDVKLVTSNTFRLKQITNALGTIKKFQKPVIVCCRSGMRSAQAASILKNNGIEVMNGGGWESLQGKL